MVDWSNVFLMLFALVLGIVIGVAVGRTASEKTKLLETAMHFLRLQNADLIKEIEVRNQERKSA